MSEPITLDYYYGLEAEQYTFLPHPQNPFQSHLQDAFCVGKDAVRAYVLTA